MTRQIFLGCIFTVVVHGQFPVTSTSHAMLPKPGALQLFPGGSQTAVEEYAVWHYCEANSTTPHVTRNIDYLLNTYLWFSGYRNPHNNKASNIDGGTLRAPNPIAEQRNGIFDSQKVHNYFFKSWIIPLLFQYTKQNISRLIFLCIWHQWWTLRSCCIIKIDKNN